MFEACEVSSALRNHHTDVEQFPMQTLHVLKDVSVTQMPVCDCSEILQCFQGAQRYCQQLEVPFKTYVDSGRAEWLVFREFPGYAKGC